MASAHTPLLRNAGGDDGEDYRSATTACTSDDTSDDADAQRQPGTFARQLSALDGFALLVSIVIGSGVFTSPGPIDANVPSPGAALVVWLVGGLMAWTGALTMAELGTAFPGEGGIQPYLSHIYGDVFGFLAAWSWIVAVMPATLAILSLVFVDSIYSSLGVHDAAPPFTHKLFSLLVLMVIGVANAVSTHTSTRLGKLFVVVKFLSIFLLIVCGLTVVFVYAGRDGRNLGGEDWHARGWFSSRKSVQPDGSIFDWTSAGVWSSLGHYSAALYGALWAYSGWDKANYVAAELRTPSEQLPLAVNTAIPTIITCYVSANAVYYVLLPWKVVSVTDSAAVTAITHFLGKQVAIVAAVLICLVVAGSLLGNSFVAGRMTVAAANKTWLPDSLGIIGRIGFSHVSSDESASTAVSPDDEMSKGASPINALLLSTLISALYVLLGNMRVLLAFNGLGEYTFFLLTVLGSVILRWREPQLRRPFKPPIIVPLVFIIISGFVVIRGAIFAPVQAAILASIWAVGALYFRLRQWWLRRRGLVYQ